VKVILPNLKIAYWMRLLDHNMKFSQVFNQSRSDFKLIDFDHKHICKFASSRVTASNYIEVEALILKFYNWSMEVSRLWQTVFMVDFILNPHLLCKIKSNRSTIIWLFWLVKFTSKDVQWIVKKTSCMPISSKKQMLVFDYFFCAPSLLIVIKSENISKLLFLI